MRTKLLITIAAAAISMAACSTSNGSTPNRSTVSAVEPTSSAAAAAPVTVAAKAATTPLGQILVDATGHTLYAFTNDADAKSTCSGTCAQAWPPLVVDANWTVAPGLDSGVFSTVSRDDGSLQLAAGKYPLYTFSGDAVPGDTNGQASGGVWFVVDGKASIVTTPAKAAPQATATATSAVAGSSATKPAAAASGGYVSSSANPTTVAAKPAAPAAAAAAIAKTASTSLGTIVVDAEGRTLYGFTKDANGTSTCVGACATTWPPMLVSGDVAVDGLDKNLFSVIDRPDGTKQLKMGKWPLYRFSGDAEAGDTDGQGSGGSWFVIGADGKLIK
jgi:predicted lipoprotein with Yx(FWY)xxD motif